MTEIIYKELESKTLDNKATGQKLSVSGVLKKLDLSTSGYYAYCNRTPSATAKRRENRMEKILRIYDENHCVYGAPKIAHIMQNDGESISERTVGKYMNAIGIRACYVKSSKRTTINPDFSEQLKNILNEKFNPKAPNAYWCTDITYINTASEGFVYLTSIMDLYSRKIVAWTLSRTLEAKHVANTVMEAIKAEGVHPKVIHSDRGSQYVSEEYKEACHGIKRSYSKKAFPWDNACIESFHSLLKREWLDRYKIIDYDHTQRLVFEYINAFYNTTRVHSHCDYMSPTEYEESYYLKQQ